MIPDTKQSTKEQQTKQGTNYRYKDIHITTNINKHDETNKKLQALC